MRSEAGFLCFDYDSLAKCFKIDLSSCQLIHSGAGSGCTFFLAGAGFGGGLVFDFTKNQGTSDFDYHFGSGCRDFVPFLKDIKKDAKKDGSDEQGKVKFLNEDVDIRSDM